MKKLLNFNNTRFGIVITSVFFIWLKTLFAYFFIFRGINSVNPADYIIMIVNPIGFTAIFFSFILFIRRTPVFYLGVLFLNLLGTLLVYGNVLFYREFSDFLSISTITGGAGLVGKGFDFTAIRFYPLDILFWIDIVIFFVLFALKKIKMDSDTMGRINAFGFFSASLMIFGITFWAGDMTEHRLVSRQAQYDDTYVVRYLGLGPWLITNGWYTHVANQARNIANKSDFTKVQKYIEDNRYLAPNVKMEGIAKNKNLIVIHLESFQQDLIDLKINGQPVTPFLNSLYHSNSVYAFSNFFNQVGTAKTVDAETMLETSTFGLQTGNFFQTYGPTQTFQAMPAILNQLPEEENKTYSSYSSAVFHGNVGTFYNRINTYRNMGYQNFFYQSFFDKTAQNSTGWGIKDKYLFADSIPYLEQLQQPFYVKYLTVTNHEPYTGLDKNELDPNFKTSNSGLSTVDNYFLTAHYLDQSIQEFFNYLKQSGLYKNSVIVLYGDHYGISGSEIPYFANAIGKDSNTWSAYDNTMMQRVPLMIDIPGQTNGYINNEYAGEIDVMPTLEHLLGVNTQKYMQFGQDLFANNRQQFVALRNQGWITPTITKPSGTSNVYYDTKTGQPLTLTPSQKTYADSIQNKVTTLLSMSDALNSEDLLRFYIPTGFTPVDSSQYSYSVASTKERLTKQQAELGASSTSLLSENRGIPTQDLFQTNEPVLSEQLEKLKDNTIPSTGIKMSSSGKSAPSSSPSVKK